MLCSPTDRILLLFVEGHYEDQSARREQLPIGHHCRFVTVQNHANTDLSFEDVGCSWTCSLHTAEEPLGKFL